MLFGLFNRKKNNNKGLDINQYSVDISTNFNDDDREYLKPIYTIKYYSKFNTSVINEAIFCRDVENGNITLNQAILTLKDILKQSIEGKLLISTMINKDCILTNEEEITVKELEDITKYLLP